MYEFVEPSDGYFTFATRGGMEYAVVFVDEESIFAEFMVEETVLAKEIMVFPTDEDSVPKLDYRVGKTVCGIIEHFISRNKEQIILYVCQYADEQQLKRHRHFSRWHERYTTMEDLNHFPIETETHYSSVIYSDEHTHIEELTEALKYYAESPEIVDNIISQSK